MLFEVLYQELARGVDIIRTLVAGITPTEARSKPSPESWSILEVICHLYDEEREDFREHLDFILHRQNEEYHVIDPQTWITERKYNEQSFVEMQEKFFAERKQSFEWLSGLPDS